MHDRTCPECGAVFSPRYGNQVCCSDKCKLNRKRQQMRESYRHGQSMTFAEEREGRAAERRNRFRLRDLEHKALGVPVKVTVDHRGIRREIRGHCAGGGLPAFGSLRDSRVLNLGF